VTARRHYPDKRVVLIRKEERALIPCGIPYILGTLGSPERNLIPDTILKGSDVDLVIDEVTALEPKSRVITTTKGMRLGYDRLVLATGSDPQIPPIPGVGKGNVFAIRKDVSYLRQIVDAVDHASDVAIVGCGFIGCELAEEIKKRRGSLNVRIVEMTRHCLQLVYDEEFCIQAERILGEKGIEILVDEKVEAFLGSETVQEVCLSSGRKIKADVVIIGVGAVANTGLARQGGLEIGPTGGIQVNRYMQTSDDSIFACGDCAEKLSFFDGRPSALKLASIATMEARIAGANLFDTRRSNMGVIGVFSTTLGDSAFAAAGLTTVQARAGGYKILVGEWEAPNRHPGGMPGSSNLKVRLLFGAATHRLLGGQVTGAASGGELINAISACIHRRMTADDMATFQTGTHPALTASPIAYQLVNAAEVALARSHKTSSAV